AAALAEVERDLAGLANRPGRSLSEVREELTRESGELRRKMQWVGCGAMAGLIGGLVGLPFAGAAGIALGFGGAVVLTAVGHVMLHREKQVLTLNRHLAGWEEQMGYLKDTAGEVHRLAEPGASVGVQERAGYLLVGGVRVPVARRRAA
ncbi:MAG: hypothetical protein AB1758_23010, partial [Candidatus Eremiobacterota bacterium]